MYMDLTAEEIEVTLEEMSYKCRRPWNCMHLLYFQNMRIVDEIMYKGVPDYDESLTELIDSVLNDYEFNYEFEPQA
jgi:hypothetical protein